MKADFFKTNIHGEPTTNKEELAIKAAYVARPIRALLEFGVEDRQTRDDLLLAKQRILEFFGEEEGSKILSGARDNLLPELEAA